MSTANRSRSGILSLTWPIFMESLFGMLLGTADTMMLSSYSDGAVAAVGVANQILTVVGLMFGFVTVGTSVVLNQWLGAGKLRDADLIGRTALTLNLMIGLLFSAGLGTHAEVFLLLFKLPPDLLAEGSAYLSIVGSSVFMVAMSMTLGTMLRCRGMVKDMMVISFGVNLLHILGNYLVLMEPFGLPVLGVDGVAVSTWISRAIALAAYWAVCNRRLEQPVRLMNPLHMRKGNLRLIFKLGIPSAGEHVSYNLSQVVITYLVALLGAAALTTKIYTQSITAFVFVFSMAIGQGTQIMVGHLIGAMRKDDAYQSGIRHLKLAVLVSLGIGIILYSLSDPMIGLFTSDPDILQLGKQLMLLSILLEPARACNMVLISSLNAAGDVKFPVLIGLVSMWGLSVPLAYLFGIIFELGLTGIWLAFAIDEWVRALVMLRRWRKRAWQRLNILAGQAGQ
ncbi:MATE family efflux transporter [Paenibacillus apiarius]|uniref:MATE family efflux transporter n=1 Tax=Paenibacillus apiarius TaxID=46240 RepID=A0ABT4DY11_9BACL|nr:MATE family efflux transporter [Paenibacillus apiarius]MCY9517500.1 MATE family efflux transporter [Paenibacillus apiarius]MCY9522221.1 MATE family efflux transporter [Paenibacillus apiarius]MCY9552255.1 MATE family efflux transporter [Paenibacillus apiarius]MCY9560134.1 MATE family efflux transporter [Paenibacillus apiarius]MCY9683752.1 MATE family efflux transporter [Paenibacillus apiarius]